MAELVVIGYDDAETAEAARRKLFELSNEYYADVGDAVVAVADENGNVHLRQMVNPWSLGAMSAPMQPAFKSGATHNTTAPVSPDKASC